jgi:hypothetical protein
MIEQNYLEGQLSKEDRLLLNSERVLCTITVLGSLLFAVLLDICGILLFMNDVFIIAVILLGASIFSMVDAILTYKRFKRKVFHEYFKLTLKNGNKKR